MTNWPHIRKIYSDFTLYLKFEFLSSLKYEQVLYQVWITGFSDTQSQLPHGTWWLELNGLCHFKHECGSLWLSQQISTLFLSTALPRRHAAYHLDSVAKEGWSCVCVGTASSQLMFQVVFVF